MRTMFLAVAALILPQAASAQAWRLAAYSNNTPQMAYLVDINSVQRNGTKVTFRQQTVYERVSDTRDFDRSLLTREVDCANNSSFMRNSDFYVNGKFLGHEEDATNPTMAKAGTVLETMLNTVCGRTDYFSPVLTDAENWVRGKFRAGF
jgi:hypothetical protein